MDIPRLRRCLKSRWGTKPSTGATRSPSLRRSRLLHESGLPPPTPRRDVLRCSTRPGRRVSSPCGRSTPTPGVTTNSLPSATLPRLSGLLGVPHRGLQSLFSSTRPTYTTYIHAYQDGGSQLVAVSGVVPSAPWRVVAKIGPGWGPSAIDSSGVPAFVMVNTTLLSSTQTIVSMSLQGSDVSEVALNRANSGLNKLSSIVFPPSFAPSSASPMGAAPGTVGSIVSVTPGTFSSDPWTYDYVTGTNMRYGAYFFDWEHQTAYAGGPSWCDAYHIPDGGNPPAAVMVIQGSWNYGGVLPFIGDDATRRTHA